MRPTRAAVVPITRALQRQARRRDTRGTWTAHGISGDGGFDQSPGSSRDDRHPEVRKGIRKIVEKPKATAIRVSVTLGINTRRSDGPITDGVESLWHRVRGVLFPRPTMIVRILREHFGARARSIAGAYP